MTNNTSIEQDFVDKVMKSDKIEEKRNFLHDFQQDETTSHITVQNNNAERNTKNDAQIEKNTQSDLEKHELICREGKKSELICSEEAHHGIIEKEITIESGKSDLGDLKVQKSQIV